MVKNCVNNQHGWINIVVAVIILVIAGIGIYIGLNEVQRTQVLRSRAQETSPTQSQSTTNPADTAKSAQTVIQEEDLNLSLFDKGGFPQINPTGGIYKIVKNTQYEIGVVGKSSNNLNDRLYICSQRYTTILDNNRDCLEKPIVRLDNLNMVYMDDKGIEERVLYGLSHTFTVGGEVTGALDYYIILTDNKGELKTMLQVAVY